MKIVVVQDYLRCGGTESQSVYLARYFEERGHEVTLLTFRPGGVLSKGVMHESLQSVDTHLNFFAPGLKRFLERRVPDVILAMGQMANFTCGRLRKKFSGLWVGGVRTGRRLGRRHLSALEELDAVIVNAHWTAEQLKRRGFSQEKIWVIPNAMMRSSLSQERIPVKNDPCVFLSVGAFRSEKGQERLLRIFSKMSHSFNWELWLVGEGKRRRYCRRFVRRYREVLGDRVYFWGYQRDPGPFYMRADVAVLASERESLPNFLVEAQGFGLPVVAYDVGGVAECFDLNRSGVLVPFGDEEKFRLECEKLMGEPERWKDMGHSAFVWAREHFSGETNAQKFLALFEELISRKMRM